MTSGNVATYVVLWATPKHGRCHERNDAWSSSSAGLFASGGELCAPGRWRSCARAKPAIGAWAVGFAVSRKLAARSATARATPWVSLEPHLGGGSDQTPRLDPL